MPILGIEYAIDRVVATLQANLPTEFDLVQSIAGLDPIPNGLADVPNGSYFKYANPVTLVEHDIAIIVTAQYSDPVKIDSITNTPGRDVSDHGVTVEFRIKDTGNEEPQVTQSRVFRSALAIRRVLAIKNITLGGTVFRCVLEGQTTYTPVTQIGEGPEGEFTGSARVPFAVRLFENLV